MQANLTRLNDLAGEVRRQLKPLGQQAEVARQAQGIASVVRDAKARLLAAEVADLQTALDETSQSEHDRKAERNILQAMLEENQVRLHELEALQVSTEVDTARNLAYRFDSISERLRSLLSISNQRVALLGAQNENFNLGNPEEFENEAQAAAAEVASLEAAVAALREQLQVAEVRRNEARDILEKFDSQVAEQNQLISNYDLELARLANEAAVAESKLAALRDQVARAQGLLAEAAERHAQSKNEYEALEQSLQSQQPGSSNLEESYEAAGRAVSDSQARIDEIRENLHVAERERDSLAAKRSALNLTLDQKDGASLLTSAGLRGIRGLVATHMKIEAGFEVAIAAALGTLADALVAENLDAGVAALEHLKATDGGRVELVIADVDSAVTLPTLAVVAGARSALEVVKAPSGVQALLQHIVIVDDLNAAKDLYRANQAALQHTVITRDGDVLTESVLRGGSSRKPSKVELVAERDAAEASLAKAHELIENLKAQLAEARATNEAASQSAKTALASLKEHDAQLAGNAEKLGRLRVQVEASQAELDRLSQQAETTAAGIGEAELALQGAIAKHDAYSSQERPTLDLNNRTTLAENLEQERQSELEIRIELGAAAERLRVEKERTVLLRRQAAEAIEKIEKAKAQALAQKAKLAAAERVLEALPLAIDAVANSANEAKLKLHDLESKRANQNAELVSLRGATAEVQMKLATLTQSVHDIEMSNHEKRLTLANLTSKAYDELGLEQAVLVAEYGPDQLVADTENLDESGEPTLKPFVREEQQRRLRDAERVLDRLGKVNPLALEEFAALEQRHKFLTEQLADLTQTRQDLLQIIADLDFKMQTIFKDAFDDTKAAFEKVFPVLFPGGSGSIFLTDPENLLTTGLEVTVKPAGKRIERLSLLSGGERSLAAVALLIAIFKARPSPFYVMDEVEAALDDANLGRLLQIFEDLRASSQLIIITHQKRTMEIADALYGVSMRQDGISAVVGQKLERA